jgi:MFS family permease
MKRYVRPSVWLATLLGSWGVFTIGFAGVQNFATVTVLRFFIGVFEAGQSSLLPAQFEAR